MSYSVFFSVGFFTAFGATVDLAVMVLLEFLAAVGTFPFWVFDFYFHSRLLMMLLAVFGPMPSMFIRSLCSIFIKSCNVNRFSSSTIVWAFFELMP